jgi:hypothetical protein
MKIMLVSADLTTIAHCQLLSFFLFFKKVQRRTGHNKGESILPAAAQHLAYKQSNAKFLRVSSSSCLLEY